MRKMQKGIDLVIRALPKTVQEERGKFAEKYTGRKKARYDDALRYVNDNGITKKDAKITMFVKAEKMSPSKRNPDPRAIQFRDPRYCVELASFLKPIEEHLYKIKVEHPLISRTRLVGKGMNQVERASTLARKLSFFKNPSTISLDAKRFDQHCDIQQLRQEHRVYTSCNPDSYFAKLLSWQLHNDCSSRLGFKYRTRGKRMSGDMNTALGNCIIMLGMVLGIMIPRGKRFDILDDGDDCLLIVETEDLESVLCDLPAAFLEMGHEIKIENIATTMEQVVWCQSSPIKFANGYKFVRNPIKVMSTALVGTRWLNTSARVRREYLAGLGECELILNQGVPILQEYALALIRNSRGAKKRFDDSSGEWFRYLRESRLYRRAKSGQFTSVILDDTRLSFAVAFGISIPDQIDIERQLADWNFSVDQVTDVPGGLDPKTWEDTRDHIEFQ